jgi:protein-tyrosine phosphatase
MRLTWLLEGRLAASGMIYPEDVPIVGHNGIGAILSLTEMTPFPEGAPDGIDHLHLPVVDMTAPRPSDLDRGVSFIRTGIEAGKPVLVHCGAGLGRTGTVLAAFLVSQGDDPDTAIQRVRNARPGSVETMEQERCIADFAAGER